VNGGLFSHGRPRRGGEMGKKGGPRRGVRRNNKETDASREGDLGGPKRCKGWTIQK